jgi:hypothetical protein
MHYVKGMVVSLLLCAALAWAGSPEPPAAPDSPESGMYTLEDIYNRLADGTTGSKREGAFAEPTVGPGPTADTGKTLDEIMDKAPAVEDQGATPDEVLVNKKFWGLNSGAWGLQTGTLVLYDGVGVSRTGQTPTTPFSTPPGSDGALEKGMPWPEPRFTDIDDGTVKDNMTGLIWLKKANCFEANTWGTALAVANGLYSGSCGLLDGSSAGDWRLPNVRELLSLIDYGRFSPVLPSGHPFTNVLLDYYWTSTSVPADTETGMAFATNLNDGQTVHCAKDSGTLHYIWPVRDEPY